MADPKWRPFEFDGSGIVNSTVAGVRAVMKEESERNLAALQATERRILVGQQTGVRELREAVRQTEDRLTGEVRAVPAAINPNYYRSNPNLHSAGYQAGGYPMPDHAPSGGHASTGGGGSFWPIVGILVAAALIGWLVFCVLPCPNCGTLGIFANTNTNSCQDHGTVDFQGPVDGGYNRWKFSSGC